MNPRERMLAIVVLTIFVVGGGFFVFNQFFWGPLQKRGDTIIALQDQIDKKTARVQEIQAEMPQLERWRSLTLPKDVDISKLKYEEWLTNLLQKEGFVGPTVTPKPVDLKTGVTATGAAAAKAAPVYAKLGYSVTGRANLGSLAGFLKKFYSTGLLHQVRTISIQKPLTQVAQQQRGDLDINLSIEALSLTNADGRKILLPPIDMRLLAVATFAAWGQGPVGLAFVPDAIGPRGLMGPDKLSPNDRDYADIARKDIFIGSTAVSREYEIDPNRFYKLTDITEKEEPRSGSMQKVRQANMFDVYNNRKTRLQVETNSSYSIFSVRDEKYNEVFHGKVVKINDRDLIFQGTENSPRGRDSYFRIKVGGTMEEALRRPLRKDELVKEGILQASSPADDAKSKAAEIAKSKVADDEPPEK
jgi:hypothetical protein